MIGVDNDVLLCQLSSPLLTSIEQGAKRIGFEAAALLDKMMQGEKVGRNSRLVEPEGIVMRLSTTATPDSDPHVAKAMSFIQMHACDGIRVSDVVDAVGVSRSGLDVRFKVSLAQTIRSAIRSTQLERAKILLTETAFAPKDIAARTGFKSVQHLNTLFKLAFGTPPGEYRRKFVSSLILPRR